MTLDKAILTLKDSLFRRDGAARTWSAEEYDATQKLVDWADRDFMAEIEKDNEGAADADTED